MVGLILAALYVAYAIVANSVEPIAAVESTLGFLWWWHIAFGTVLLCIGLVLPCVGAAVTLAGSTAKEKGAGLAVLIGSPFILFLLVLTPILFLGGVYCLDSGIESGEIVNQNHVIVGGILYGIGILFRLCSRSSSSSSS